MLAIDRVRVFAVRAVPESCPVSSLGAMPLRNGLLVEATTEDGAVGWGETWCNFPPQGNVARLNLFADVVAPAVLGRTYTHFSAMRHELETRFRRMAIHTGEPGSFWQCVAGLDMALADALARRESKRLCDFLHDGAGNSVPVYASTPDVSCLEDSIKTLGEAGHTAFKLKIGFGSPRDSDMLRRFRAADPRAKLMVDVNQNWSLDEAKERIASIERYDIAFVEEPLLATDAVWQWAELAKNSSVPLAAGENITSLAMFEDFLVQGKLNIVQPDVTKWGGISGAMDVAALAKTSGAICALHYMGTAVGLAASIHVMAA
ncbi:MAG: mandelate racemase/muconate lactonizing enzyme family protein, partial [Rhodobacteraceae bacterium]|nr:mandelate racemase/muconate lactonizing enzyme family protein [Paracoccaceae bacterium]